MAAPCTIGLPRAFHHYSYPDLWPAFFSALGHEPVLSAPSSRLTIELAARISEAEHCLPNKLFDAHLAELADRVELVFVPRTLSMLKGHLSCPKLGALPDAARVHLGQRKGKLLTVDLDENRLPLVGTLELLGRRLGARGATLGDAIARAMREMEEAEARLATPTGSGGRRVLLLGHPYTVRDRLFTGPVLAKLTRLGVTVEPISFRGDAVPESEVKWDTCNKMLHRLQTISRADFAGVIQLTMFNCGCDSMMVELYRELLASKKIPYLVLMFDEHLAQGGVETRLEAFVETLR